MCTAEQGAFAYHFIIPSSNGAIAEEKISQYQYDVDIKMRSFQHDHSYTHIDIMNLVKITSS